MYFKQDWLAARVCQFVCQAQEERSGGGATLAYHVSTSSAGEILGFKGDIG